MKNKSINRSRGRWVLVALFAMMLSMALALWSCTQARDDALLSTGFQPPVMAAAQYVDKPARGDLGGVLVEIPPYMAEYLEYDGDPGWRGDVRTKMPTRAPDSKIASFGFNVLYPDMLGKADYKSREQFKNRDHGTTNWLSVNVISGESYSGEGSVDTLTKNSLKRKLSPETEFFLDKYERLDNDVFNLEAYAVKGFDPENGEPYRRHKWARDIFVARDTHGRAVSYISCDNWDSPMAPCRHNFDMSPEMKVSLIIHYRRGLLSEWACIQASVAERVKGFAIKS